MTSESEMARTGIAARVQAGHSPPLRKRRTREYIPNSRTKLQQHMGNNDQGLQDENHELANELTFRTRENGYHHYPDENMNTISRSDTTRSQYQDILKFVPENSHLSERYQILRAENKILRERLQNALQREMKALKTFKRLAKENRQLKMNLRKYERTLLGFYDDESGLFIKNFIHFFRWWGKDGGKCFRTRFRICRMPFDGRGPNTNEFIWFAHNLFNHSWRILFQ